MECEVELLVASLLPGSCTVGLPSLLPGAARCACPAPPLPVPRPCGLQAAAAAAKPAPRDRQGGEVAMVLAISAALLAGGAIAAYRGITN